MTEKRKVFRELCSLEDAISALQTHWAAEPLPAEKVPLTIATGRVLADDVYSEIDVPHFDRAAMDGFAVRAEDTFSADEQRPVRLRLLALVEAGDASEHAVAKGQAVEVATGAPIPKGANAVVMVEFTKVASEEVTVYRAVTPGENVAGAGTDIACGELLIRKSQKLTSRDIGLLAGIGLEQVLVHRKPKVAIFSSGNELLKQGDRLSFGKLYDINGPTLIAAVTDCGGEPSFMGILPDDYSTIKKRLESALGDADVVITSGSTSSGPGDILYRVADELGQPGVLVHGLSLKPGKPALIGLAGKKPIFGLPGYPTSALMIFHVLVVPFIRRLANLTETEPTRVQAFSPMKFSKARGRRELVPVQLITQPGAQFLAYPMQSGSGAVSSFSLADGFADLPETQEFVEEGEKLEVELFAKELMPPSLVAIGSHCLGLDVAFAMLREKDSGFLGRTINLGSTGGFHAVEKGQADFAGVHLLDEKTGEYNIPFIRLFHLEDSAVLVRGYNREQGLIIEHGNPKGIQSIADVTRENVRFVNRNRGSGTRLLIDKHLREIAQGEDISALTSKIHGYDYEVKSHSAVAAAIKNDRADVGYGIRTAAALAGLDFIKTDDEKYDLLLPKSRLGKASVKAFIDLLKSNEFEERLLNRAPGLRTTNETGNIVPIT